MTEPEPLQQTERTYVLSRGRKLSYFAGCDYYRLASHPSLARAVQRAVSSEGLNVAASRLTTGNHVVYRELERALADYFDAESALLVPTGYLTNLVVAQALAGRLTHALIDECAHPSLMDAAQLFGSKILPFRHGDPADVAKHVRSCGSDPRLILLTDGMFARNGEAAPLRAYKKVLLAGTVLLVDDAHGAGVLGKHGRGTLEHENISRRNVIQTVTLSKAFGAFGGAVLGSKQLRHDILSRSRIFIGSTPLPLPLARAGLAAVKLLSRQRGFMKRLRQNRKFVRDRLRKAGFDLEDAPGPIVPFFPRTSREQEAVARALLRSGIHSPFIKYPGGPENGYFRFVISSEHSWEQLLTLCNCLSTCRHLLSTQCP